MDSEQNFIRMDSGNIFADLNLKNPDELLIKAQLLERINDLIDGRTLTQEAAAKILGMPRPEVSHLRRGRISRFTIDRLVKALCALEPTLRVRVVVEKREVS